MEPKENLATKSKVTEEVATAEVDKWLDYKKISPSKRVSKKASIEQLINGIVDGDLSLSPEMEFVQALKLPVGKDNQVKEFRYKARINIGSVQHHLRQVAADDGDGRIVCYIQGLTGQPSAIIKALDTADYDIAQSIALFFV